MKKYIIVFVLVYNFFNILLGQNSFEFIYEDSLDTYGITTFMDNQGYFVTIGSTGNFIELEFSAMCMKFKNENDILIQIYQKEDTISIFKFGFPLSNGNYFVVGSIKDQDVYSANLYVAEIDQDLNIVWEKIYEVPDMYNNINVNNLYLRPDSAIFLNAELNDPPPGNIGHHYFAKLNTQGDLLDTMINTIYHADFSSEIVGKPDNSGIYVIGVFSFVNLIEIDNELNIVNCIPLNPDHFYSDVGARMLSNGNFVIGSLANQEVPGAVYDLQMRISDVNLVPIKDTVIFDDGWNFLPVLSGLDFTDENNIWTATYPLLGDSYSDWEYGCIYIFDTSLNVKGAKYFGGSSSLYLFSLKAIEDGGCIITGITPDENNSDFHDVFFKKVMPYDIITHAEETSEPNDYDVLIYPNPVENELKIETYRRNLEISLFSSDGVCVILNKELTVPYTIIETTNLIMDAYIYKISANGNIIQTGKIIKK